MEKVKDLMADMPINMLMQTESQNSFIHGNLLQQTQFLKESVIASHLENK